jgi:flagellar hook protein FlgE
MSFYTSLSGLQVAQTDMSTISHNLANVSTNGFKKSRSEFADVMASTFTSDPRRLTGSGAVLKQNVQQFGEGSLNTTSSALDMAVSGDGFFTVKTAGNNGTTAYTRNGSFVVNSDRNIVDAQGSYLQAYPVDASGNVTATGADGLTNVQIPETSGMPVATTKVGLNVNLATSASTPMMAFNRANASSYNNATSTTIYDSDGNAQTMTSYYVRNSAADAPGSTAWKVYSFVGDQQLAAGGNTGIDMTFNASGTMTAPTAATTFDAFTPAASGTAQTISLDFTGSQSKTSTFSVAGRSQNGASIGQLSGLSVNEQGLITASYSNGETQRLGKVALASFTTPTGLRQQGNSYFASTGISGSAKLGTASENGYGALMSGTIEGSNVDITEELVNLIAAQRNFQANAKALDTQSQISQTIFNIRS